jgi:AsmA family protein
MLQKILVFLLSLLLLFVVAFGYLLWFANTGQGRQTISATASDWFDRDVEYSGSAHLLAEWPPTVRFSGFRIGNMEDGRADDMLNIKEAQVSWSPFALLRGAIKLPYIFVDGGELHLERLADNRANWRFGGKDEPDDEDGDNETMLELGTLYLRDATVSYYDAPQNIDLKIAARTEEKALFAEGNGTYLGQPFALNFQGAAIMEAREDAPYPFEGRLTVGRTTVTADGTLKNPTQLEGMDVQFGLSGEDASELFPLFGIALPPTAPYNIMGNLQYADKVWNFNGFVGSMGESDIAGDVEWDASGDRPMLTADFFSQRLDFKDLSFLIGSERGALESNENPYVIPNVSLDITRMAAMDADVEFTGKQLIAPNLPLDDFYLYLTLEDRLLRIDPVAFGTADGEVTANLRVDARKEPVDITSDFRFSKLSLARLTEGLKESLPNAKTSNGLIGGGAQLKGQGKSLKEMLSTANGNIGIGMEGGELSNLLVELMGLDLAQSLGFMLTGDKTVPVRCGVGDFAVKDGIMQSRAVVLDTVDTKVLGEGTINLENERMNLRLLAQPKDSTLASLRTPLRVEGTLQNPDVIIEKTALLARGAGAVALSAVLTPAAGALALLEPSTGEDSDCAALLSQMRSRIQNSGEVPVNVPLEETDAAREAEEAASDTAEEPPMDKGEPMRPDPAGENIVTHPGEANPIKR